MKKENFIKLHKTSEVYSSEGGDPTDVHHIIDLKKEKIGLKQVLEDLKPHDHLCLIYESKDEWRAAIVPFISIGLKRGEKCLYIVDASTADEIRGYLHKEGIDVLRVEKSGQLSILHHSEAYTLDGLFDPDRMIKLLITETKKALSEGYIALRATGEMTWVLKGSPGSEKLLEYESKLNKDFFPKYPCLAICQYDRWRFEPEIIKGVLMTHPLLIKGDQIYRNFYYIPPEEYLSHKFAEKEVEHWLNNLEREHKLIEYIFRSGEGIKKRIKESEETYRNIFQNAQVGLFRTRISDGKILESNDQLAKMFGYDSREEFIAEYVTSLNYVDPGTREKMLDILKKDGFIKNFEARFYRKDRSIFWARYSAKIYPDKGWIEGVAEDITELKRASEELRNEKERLQALLDQAPFGIAVIDQDGSFKYINPKFTEIFGYLLSDIPDGKTWFRKAYPDTAYRNSVIKAWKDDLKKSRPGEKRPRIFKVKCKDGLEKIINFIPVQLTSGENLMACEDITSIKLSEQALRESEEKFRELYENAPVGYHELDHEGKIICVNQTELDMLGYDAQEMVGQYLWKFVADPGIKEIISGKLSGEIPPGSSYERQYIKKDGTILPVLAQDRLLKDKEGNITGIRVTIQDISELKRLENDKKALEEQLRQSQKMEAIGQLAGGIAHDFNNILTAIIGYCNLSLSMLRKEDPLKRYIEEIDRAAQRASELTGRLLAFGRKQILDVKVIDLNKILLSIEGMLRRVIREDIELCIFTAEGGAMIKADPSQIEQIIINLVTNARDAMPEGGKLIIETANVELDEEYASKHIGVKPGRYVMLSVSDTGKGMTEEVKNRIFEPFFTTKESGKGTGLGLPMVYGIVKQSGGNIWVYSEPNKGTTFKIYFPVAEKPYEESFVEYDGQEAKVETQRGGETILVVEDEEAVRQFAVIALQRQGYKVLSASNGDEALLLSKNFNDLVNLVLTDVVMPGMSGRKLVERLKELYPEIKALYMSGYTDNAIVHQGILDAHINFIQKPFTVERLVKKVREVLDYSS
ncbi:MAG: MEDS domain-containing protein [Thermodesulfovibrionales bacterium]|nr:MEDS domain-containing protein [Thermodesulfovibrionales bacterium]